MRSEAKIEQLKGLIYEQLSPFVTGDYVYLDLPYHSNIGDILIWEGTRQFLNKFPYHCLYSTAYYNYMPPKIDKDVIIFLHGGGNWGDLWRQHQEFRMRIMKEFPQNKIVILPQTVFYADQKTCLEDLAFVNKYPNVVVCARDQRSYDLLVKHLKKQVLLVPDMAFCIEGLPRENHGGERNLFVQRRDKEFLEAVTYSQYLPQEYTVRDWPTCEEGFSGLPDMLPPFHIRVAKKLRVFSSLYNKWLDNYYNKVLRPFYIKCGIDFINEYDKIYTTRLHVTILSTLLGKEVTFFDNSYGKNSGFYETWLQDCDSVKFIRL